VEVKKPLPVSIMYSTAFLDEKGRMNFRKDVYGYDKETAARMFTTTKLPPASAG
jgi:murein L,D-transpeptidase YcbB/YkuD